MDFIIRKCKEINSSITLPGDKSIAHRALILASIANGKSTIRNLHVNKDIDATIKCLRMMGVRIKYKDKTAIVTGRGLRGLKIQLDILNAGDSATTFRLFLGLLSGHKYVTPISGSHRLLKRPMDDVIKPLRRMGTLISSRLNPCVVMGRNTKAIKYVIPKPSAQTKSALLIASLFAKGKSRITEPIPTRNHTELILKAMGVKIKTHNNTITIKPPKKLKPIDMTLPGDISLASYFIALALVIPGSKITINKVGLNKSRLGFIRAVKEMGADVRLRKLGKINGEPYGKIIAKYSDGFSGVVIDKDIPSLIDEIPILAVIATKAKGQTIIRNARALRFKESDRIKATVTELKKLGADIKETKNGLVIKGPVKLRGKECKSYYDHRIIMALTVAGLMASAKTTIVCAQAVSKSYPIFLKVLKGVVNQRKCLRSEQIFPGI